MRTAPAYAKINLSLEVLGRRLDGYHELVSVMQTVSLSDEITVQPNVAVQLSCSDPALEHRDNLVVRAAESLRAEWSVEDGCSVVLTKRIPAAAGLGGGSSDAATTLVLLNELWNLGASLSDLAVLAAQLGSDVPYFLVGGTAFIEGRGERVTPLPDGADQYFVLANPRVPLSTADVFRNVRSEEHGTGAATLEVRDQVLRSRIAPFGVNGLQDSAFRICPPAQRCFESLQARAPGSVILSGSGPTSVARVDGPDEATQLTRAMQADGYWATAAKSIGRGEMIV